MNTRGKHYIITPECPTFPMFVGAHQLCEFVAKEPDAVKGMAYVIAKALDCTIEFQGDEWPGNPKGITYPRGLSSKVETFVHPDWLPILDRMLAEFGGHLKTFGRSLVYDYIHS